MNRFADCAAVTWMLRILLAASLLFGMSVTLHTALAQGPDGQATYYVDVAGTCGGQTPCYTTVQAAVDDVDDADDIVKVAAGTYTGVNSYGGESQLVYISKTHEEFLANIERAVSEPEALRERRIQIARENTKDRWMDALSGWILGCMNKQRDSLGGER